MTESVATAPIDPRAGIPRRGYLRRTLTKATAIIGVSWIAVVALAAIFAPVLSPWNPIATDLSAILELPNASHWLGTDQLGRDILTRLMYGGGETLLGSLLAVAVAVVVGLPLGILAGYYGGALNTIGNRFADLLLTVPSIIVLLTVLAVFGNSIVVAMVTLGLLLSASFLRLAAASTKEVRASLYVDAAQSFGVRDFRILWRHVLPNMIGPIVVQASVTLGISLLIQAGLGFLGLGTRPPFPSWGQMVSEASQQIYSQPWLMVPAGLAIVFTTLAFNFIGDAARDSLPQAERGNLLAVAKKAAHPAPGDPAASRSSRRGTPHPIPVIPADVLLRVDDLRVGFPSGQSDVDVVRGVSFDLRRGTTLGLVGESGSGKTMTALAVLGLVPAPGSVTGGHVYFGGSDLTADGEASYRGVRGKRIALISQEPMVALDPSFKVKTHLRAPLRRLRGLSRRQADEVALELLATVGMRDPKAVYDSYAHQLSGGMAQRVAIAWALAGEPELLIADEPTTALDVTVQAGILDLLRSLQEKLGMTVLIVTHDLGVVADICDDVAVMQHGQIVEHGPAATLLTAPQHPYTQALLGHANALDRDLGSTALTPAENGGSR
jgi:peptide/nickel transport system permease protein